jgi:hypothetical protein
MRTKFYASFCGILCHKVSIRHTKNFPIIKLTRFFPLSTRCYDFIGTSRMKKFCNQSYERERKREKNSAIKLTFIVEFFQCNFGNLRMPHISRILYFHEKQVLETLGGDFVVLFVFPRLGR